MIDVDTLPTEHGCYALHLRLTRSRVLQIGRLGHFTFPAGEYIYVGSAFGSGGLRARLGRHLRGDGAPHWHIDYLRAVAEVRACFYTVSDTRLECVWGQALAAVPGATIPVPGFGSSDCQSGCAAHLIALPPRVNVRRVLEAVAPSTVVSLQLR